MGKKKASSIDEVMDIIFIKKSWVNLRFRLESNNRLGAVLDSKGES